MNGGEDRNEPGLPEEVPEEEEGGSLAPNPELEAAMREALEAIPDAAARKQEPEDPETVLSSPIEGDPIQEVHRLQSELAETHDRLLRLQADFENFRRRAGREHREALLFGPQNVVKDLLSVVDNLDRAIDHARKSEGGDLQGLLQGVELVKRELLGVLEKHHVSEIEAQGQPFDPAYHEAMAQVHDDAVEPNTVLEVLQKGYQLRDRLLRPAQVVVAKKAEGADGGGQGEAPE